MQDLFKEGTPAVTALIQFGKNFPVLQEQDSAGITGGEGVVSHHEDRGIQLLIDALDSGQKHLRRVAVQRTSGLISQQQFGVIDDGPGAGTPLFLPP